MIVFVSSADLLQYSRSSFAGKVIFVEIPVCNLLNANEYYREIINLWCVEMGFASTFQVDDNIKDINAISNGRNDYIQSTRSHSLFKEALYAL